MNIDKESKSDKKKIGVEGGGLEIKTVSQIVKSGHLHNVRHAVQLSF